MAHGFVKNHVWVAALAGVLIAAALPAHAQVPLQLSRDQPVLLQARELGYDRDAAVVIAVGDVEVVQGETVLLADRLTYNQNTNVVQAGGNVSVAQADGNVYFAESVTLQDDMKAGVVKNFRARLSDNSLFAAREARKVDDHTTELTKAVYSPCKLCKGEDGSGKPPLWQVKAGHVTYDEAEQRIFYNDAYFEVYGLPVFYTPYFSHPTPDAKHKTGILTPEYSNSGSLGTMVKVPFYAALAPNMDTTITPIYLSKEASVMEMEFRHLTEAGQYKFRGSITYPDKRDDLGQVIPDKNEMRGHIEGKGHFALNETFSAGFDFKRTTDDTYLRRYRYGYEDTLTSRAYVEGLKGRNYAIAEGLAFQGLSVDDDPDRSPIVMPMFDVHAETNPMFLNSRFLVDANAMILTRDLGSESKRVSLTGGWKVPYVTQSGHVFEFVSSVRADAYSVSDVSLGNTTYEGSQYRVIPQVELGWRYPMSRPMEGGGSLLVEPVVRAIASPSRDPSGKIPNEDSQGLEFSDLNLFSANRSPGIDDLETGPRIYYGVRSQMEIDPRKRVQLTVGQNYQQNNDNLFPLTNERDDHYSDVVGRLAVTYDAFDIAYRFKLDAEDMQMTHNEVNSWLNWSPVRFNLNYTYSVEEPFVEDHEEVSGGVAADVHENWTLVTGGRRDMRGSAMLDASASLIYHNECVNVTTRLAREYTRDRDIEPETSVSVRVGLKNME